MAKLINGDGNKAIYADQDADLIASICGNVTCIAVVGEEYAATQEDANTIGLADGVIITKEGRRIQLDTGYTDLFDIPTGTTGVTNYYIIGYHLYINDDNAQVCEAFVQKMNSSTETITEDTFKDGATEVYVSVYRVTQVGLNISTISLLLAKLSNISEIKSDLTDTDTKLEITTSDYYGYIYYNNPSSNYILIPAPNIKKMLGDKTVNAPASVTIGGVGTINILNTYVRDNAIELATSNTGTASSYIGKVAKVTLTIS